MQDIDKGKHIRTASKVSLTCFTALGNSATIISSQEKKIRNTRSFSLEAAASIFTINTVHDKRQHWAGFKWNELLCSCGKGCEQNYVKILEFCFVTGIKIQSNLRLQQVHTCRYFELFSVYVLFER